MKVLQVISKQRAEGLAGLWGSCELPCACRTAAEAFVNGGLTAPGRGKSDAYQQWQGADCAGCSSKPRLSICMLAVAAANSDALLLLEQSASFPASQ